MKLESTGLLIDMRAFGERDSIARIFTADFGVMVGMLKAAQVAKKNKPLLGQVGSVSWNARLDNSLGTFHFESEKNLAAALMTNPKTLMLMNSAFALIATLLPEREKCPSLYNKTIELLELLSHPPREGGSESADEVLHDTGWGVLSERGYSKQTLSNAQGLRKNTTDAEKELWNCLGRYKNHLGFSRQRPIGKYIVDFINFDKKIIIELDGAQHGTEDNRNYDSARDEFLKNAGYTILRFWNDEVYKKMQMILDSIYHHMNLPHPEIDSQFRPALRGRVNATEPYRQLGSPEQMYIDWEINFLSDLGYALNLSGCSGCGRTQDLNYLSPKTGRAVCNECATPYIGRLYELPVTMGVLRNFVEKACEQQGVSLPMARKLL